MRRTKQVEELNSLNAVRNATPRRPRPLSAAALAAAEQVAAMTQQMRETGGLPAIVLARAEQAKK